MHIAMVDPSLFTGRYDDSLCAALVHAGAPAGGCAQVVLHGRPMRDTDAIQPEGYRYSPSFFGLSERLRGALGDGVAFRAVKAAEYLAQARLGGLADLRAADVVHVQWLPFPSADRMLIARLARGRGANGRRPALIHTVHNASAFHGDSGAQGAGYRALLDRFDTLVVHGEETRAALIAQGVGGERLHIVPHPPMELAAATPADLTAVPDPAVPRILFFGTIRPYKGFDLLIEACLALWNEGLVFELAVAGKPFFDIAPLIERVKAAGYGDRLVVELGFLTESRLDAHMRKADIIAFPYRHIDSSGAFLSALHHGKAMVATRVGMFATLDDDAVALCPPDDAAALAGALRGVIGDATVRARLGEAALAMRAAMGQWSDAAALTLQVYERVLERADRA
ncbi:MAG: glycosyltransferase [Sphingomonadales bacterium]|nr:MAG: glycosyltransferase [Sphingomonadales bacterium]TNF05536.1 MAG: glycosyltransferase [Sphingomonadales bacterium]